MSSPISIFLLMGQSNMAGRGLVGEVDPIRDERIRVFRNGEWRSATEPLHYDKESAGVGLAMSFAEALLERNPESAIGFVPCAVGSTPIARWMPGADLYRHAVEQAGAARQGGSIKGLLWHQGEHDSIEAGTARDYGRHFERMIRALREELNEPALPVVVGGLGNFLAARPDFPYSHIVDTNLRKLPRTVSHCGFASSEGLGDKGDSLHFDARSLREFGRRYADVYFSVTEKTPKRSN